MSKDKCFQFLQPRVICVPMKTQSNIVVKKFGGTSVGSLEKIEAVADRVYLDYKNGQNPVVVVSAMSGETNRLVGMARTIDPTYRGPAYDMILASGEQVSTALLAIALNRRGIKSKPFLGFQLGIQTDSLFSKAKILKIDGDKLLDSIHCGEVPVVAGFQGVTEDSQITTLGRGGSDTTAVALSVALNLNECEIYTDVPAVFTADPRLVPKASEIEKLSFSEMMEMASLGSKVLHYRCVELAAKYGVKIHLRSSFESRSGTWVVPSGELMENPVVSGLTHDFGIVVLKLYPLPKGPGSLSKVFNALGDKGINVDIITQSQNEDGQRIAFSIPEDDLNSALEKLNELEIPKDSVHIMDNVAKVSAVGVGMANHSGVAATFFKVLSELNIESQLVTTSDIKISVVIDRDKVQELINQLHTTFSLDNSVEK